MEVRTSTCVCAKQMWQKIVSPRILNNASCLEFYGGNRQIKNNVTAESRLLLPAL